MPALASLQRAHVLQRALAHLLHHCSGCLRCSSHKLPSTQDTHYSEHKHCEVQYRATRKSMRTSMRCIIMYCALCAAPAAPVMVTMRSVVPGADRLRRLTLMRAPVSICRKQEHVHAEQVEVEQTDENGDNTRQQDTMRLNMKECNGHHCETHARARQHLQ